MNISILSDEKSIENEDAPIFEPMFTGYDRMSSLNVVYLFKKKCQVFFMNNINIIFPGHARIYEQLRGYIIIQIVISGRIYKFILT